MYAKKFSQMSAFRPSQNVKFALTNEGIQRAVEYAQQWNVSISDEKELQEIWKLVCQENAAYSAPLKN